MVWKTRCSITIALNFALEYIIRKAQENCEGIEFKGTDYVNLLGENKYTIENKPIIEL
jgi:hypothetical protein